MGRQRERQPIRLGDDSPMLGIYSIRRRRRGGGGEREGYVGVEERGSKRFGRRPGQHHRTAIREWWREIQETAEIKGGEERRRRRRKKRLEGQSREGGWKNRQSGGEGGMEGWDE